MSEVNDMGCAEFGDVAAELALGVLTGRERARALAHLERCDACREDVRLLTVTGEELVGLLPAIEPPAGFETRVMDRLGLAAPAPARPLSPARRLGRRLAGWSAAGSGRLDGAGRASPAPDPGHRGRRRGRRRGGPGRLGPARCHLVSGRVAAELRPAADRQPPDGGPHLPLRRRFPVAVHVRGPRRRRRGNGTVLCQVEDADGHVTTVGSFRLSGGYGHWGSPVPPTSGPLTSARLVTTTGTVLATAAFPA